MSNSFNYHLHDMIFVNCFSRNLFIYFHWWMVVTKETILRMRAAVGSWYLIWTRTKPNFLPRAVCCHPMVLTCFTSVLINTQHNTPKHTHVMTFLHPLFVIWSLHTCHCTMGKCTRGGRPTICTNWQLFFYLKKPSFVNISLKAQSI